MINNEHGFPVFVLLRLQSWLSPVLPTGTFSYSHGLEWAVEAGHIRDRKSLVDWLEADLCYGSGRNEAIFFIEAWQCAIDDDRPRLFEIAELAAAFRAISELALESSQQAAVCLGRGFRYGPIRSLLGFPKCFAQHIFSRRWPWFLKFGETRYPGQPRAFLQGYVANLVMAGVRLIPLGQTDGQLAIALADLIMHTGKVGHA